MDGLAWEYNVVKERAIREVISDQNTIPRTLAQTPVVAKLIVAEPALLLSQPVWCGWIARDDGEYLIVGVLGFAFGLVHVVERFRIAEQFCQYHPQPSMLRTQHHSWVGSFQLRERRHSFERHFFRLASVGFRSILSDLDLERTNRIPQDVNVMVNFLIIPPSLRASGSTDTYGT